MAGPWGWESGISAPDMRLNIILEASLKVLWDKMNIWTDVSQPSLKGVAPSHSTEGLGRTNAQEGTSHQTASHLWGGHGLELTPAFLGSRLTHCTWQGFSAAITAVHQLLIINHLLTDHILIYTIPYWFCFSENWALIHRGQCFQWERQWKRPWIKQQHGVISVKSHDETVWDSFLSKLEVSDRDEALRDNIIRV